VTLRDGFQIALFLAGGGGLALHCARAGVRELRSGIAKGLTGTYPRSSAPLGFWTVIAGDWIAALLGLVFFCVGVAGLAGLFS
jgi:hypothetical protein